MKREVFIPESLRFERLRVGILASGNATAAKTILQEMKQGTLNGEICALITNTPEAPALSWETESFPRYVINKKTSQHPDEEMYVRMRDNGVNMVISCGYMLPIPEEVHQRILTLNIHPADTKRFGGKGMYKTRVHKAVLASGVKTTYITIHKVTHGYDTGEIIAQFAIPVNVDDTAESLQQRVKEQEGKFLVSVLRQYI